MSGTTFYTDVPSPVGSLRLVATTEALTAIWFAAERDRAPVRPDWKPGQAPFQDVIRQLDAYFRGTLRRFDLPLAPSGTPFQQAVWAALREIPYGQTVSYGELARRVGQPGAGRAVGAANGKNPIPIVIPCHRVIGADGRLTGYGGGLSVKAALIALEQRESGAPPLFPADR
jgi:methylated-DNA-[protein]-cysteine S-methyltransferase